MKKIVVINGHPDPKSFNKALADSYRDAALDMGIEVRSIALGELDFNPNLNAGYRERMELESDLIKALDDLEWSDHQVWIHPMWWLGMPAVMKGFFDRAFLPGIVFKTNVDGVREGLLHGKSARIITTAGDVSHEVYEQVYASSGLVQLQKGILEYCGISPIENTFIGPMEALDENDRKKWLVKMKQLVALDVVS